MKTINLSNETNSTGNDLQDMRQAVSQSGTAGQCLSLCFIGIVIITMIFVLMAVTGCSAGNDVPSDNAPPDTSLAETPAAPTDASEPASPAHTMELLETPEAQSQGETIIFEYDTYFTENRAPFSVEITNVISTEVAVNTDDGGTREHTHFVVSSGAKLSVINADMNDGSLSESGLPYPQWSVYSRPDELTPITDDMNPFEITLNTMGIINNEASVYVLTFEMNERPLVDLYFSGIGEYISGLPLLLTSEQQQTLLDLLETVEILPENEIAAPGAYPASADIYLQNGIELLPALPPVVMLTPWSDGTFGMSGNVFGRSQELFEYVHSLVYEITGADITGYDASEIRDLVSAELGYHSAAIEPGQSQIVTDSDSLRSIESMFQNAKPYGRTACPFGLELTLTRADGAKFTYAIADDSCDMALSEFGVSLQYGIGGTDDDRRAVMESIFDEIFW